MIWKYHQKPFHSLGTHFDTTRNLGATLGMIIKMEPGSSHHEHALLAHQSMFGEKIAWASISKFFVIEIDHNVQMHVDIVEFTYLVQERYNSSVLAKELHLHCTNLSI